MVTVLIVALALSAAGCFLLWVSGRLRKAAALVDDIVYPGSAAHRAALRSVEDGTAPNLTVWRGMSTAEQEACDTAALDLAEQAELDAREAAEEAARAGVEGLARRVQDSARSQP